MISPTIISLLVKINAQILPDCHISSTLYAELGGWLIDLRDALL
jgi:hypothetical protein